MIRRTFVRLAAILVATAAMAGTPLLNPGTASAAPTIAAPRVLYYDASRAAEFIPVIHQGADIWNSSVANVQLVPVPAGRRPNITVIADNGWPRAQVSSLGNGRWYMGRQAVRDGHYPPRISAHEFGHLLGLPDRRTGRCTDLMSGASAGTSCQNAFPNANEIREVNRNFAGLAVTAPALATAAQPYACVY